METTPTTPQQPAPPRSQQKVELCPSGGKVINPFTGECRCCSD